MSGLVPVVGERATTRFLFPNLLCSGAPLHKPDTGWRSCRRVFWRNELPAPMFSLGGFLQRAFARFVC